MSTQRPRLDDRYNVSSMSALATVIALGDRAGVRSHEDPPVLPALTMGITPTAASRSIATSWWVPLPLSDACITIGRVGSATFAAATASHPAAMTDRLPWPSESITLMHDSVTFGATPVRQPPTVPATWEPCPLSSMPAGSKGELGSARVVTWPGVNSSWLGTHPPSIIQTVTPAPRRG